MVSVAEGLRMMQGGVDRTGFAKMAEGLGNPGLDLIKQRQEEARLQALLNSMMQVDDEGGLTDMSGLPTSGPSAIDEATGKFESGQTVPEEIAQGVSDYFDFKPGVTDVIENIIEAPVEGVQFLQEQFNKGVEQGQDEMATPLSVFGDIYRDAKPFVSDVLKGGGNLFLDQYNKLLNTPIEDYDYETEFFKNLFEGGGSGSIPIYGGMQDGGPVFGTMQDAADFQRTEMLEQGKQQMQERTTPEITTNILPDEIVEPFENPPIGIGGRITDDVFTAGYGMPIGTGGMAGQLTMPFESDPTLQLMLEQQLADDLSLNADVSLMEDRDPLLNLMLTKTF